MPFRVCQTRQMVYIAFAALSSIEPRSERDGFPKNTTDLKLVLHLGAHKLHLPGGGREVAFRARSEFLKHKTRSATIL